MGASTNGTTVSTHECKSLAADYLAVIQSNHRSMRHLLLSDKWALTDDAFLKVCQSCPNLEQLGFACNVPPMNLLRRCVTLVPKLFAMRILIRPDSEQAQKMESTDVEMHQFALATELWHPEYKNLKYIGMGDKLVFKLGGVAYPKGYKKGSLNGIPPGQENSVNAKLLGPLRRVDLVGWEEVKHVEIWGMDNTEFDPSFP
jgi:hypothetical protein